MAINIAVAGKGGTGKTSFCAILIRYLIENKKVPILAVDADANANLNEALGMEIDGDTISELIAKTKDLKAIPVGMSQDQYIEYKLNASLAEGKDVDLVVMGGPDGPGCYCFPNNILRKYLNNLADGYKYVVMDNEAGLEHISRRTTSDIEILFIVSDGSARSVRSAARVHKLVEQIDTKIKKMYLVITKSTPEWVDELQAEIEKTGLELIGIVPNDPMVADYDLKGMSLFSLPDESTAVQAVYSILDKAQI
jgi:CO dehydrogenase maturation factor